MLSPVASTVNSAVLFTSVVTDSGCLIISSFVFIVRTAESDSRVSPYSSVITQRTRKLFLFAAATRLNVSVVDDGLLEFIQFPPLSLEYCH